MNIDSYQFSRYLMKNCATQNAAGRATRCK
nr:MAG TPA_asm: hypothetical protein [Caudoviricetes sp.]